MTKGHRIEIAPAGVRVEVRLGGETIADSTRALRLDETGLPPRYYLPRDDVRADVLQATSAHSTCPFKGEASYWSVEVNGTRHDDVVWSYPTPIPDAAPIAGRLCFYNERVDLVVDGEPQTRPQTPYSTST
jgi:uncharacterized protein (DUF427 family)